MLEKLTSQKKYWLGIFGMVLIAAITYLPLVSKIGYLNDDWYLMYDGYIGGADFFHQVYSVDRPLRGYLMQAAFTLFGMNPLNYHISAFVFRVLSGFGLLWLCDQLWPSRKFNNILIATFFLIYPGFLSQINPIDYQSQIFSLACGMFSVALTVKAVTSTNSLARWGYAVSSIVLAWVYLGLVEYFIGFEALRLMSVILLYWRDGDKKIYDRLKIAFIKFIPFIAGAGGFLIWRLFFFEAERKATDVTAQLSGAFTSPLTILWWLNYLIQDMFKVVIAAWAVPLNLLAFSLRLRDQFAGYALASLAVVIISMSFRFGVGNDDGTESGKRSDVNREQFWLALITIAACLMPAILVNRHVEIPAYSRYALAASAGVAILLSVVIDNLSTRSIKLGVTSLFVAMAVLTHFGNAMPAANETQATRDFWWQVSWRAPNIKEGITLLASYPGSPLSEDYFIWSPANLIYYPKPQDTPELIVKLPAAILADDVVLSVITNGATETPLRRGNYLERDFGNVLLLVQTSADGCLRIINGSAPELSSKDQQRVLLTAPYSRLENVVTDGDAHIPPAEIFGKEPEHGWCYYYQKADLARQRGEWDQVLAYLDEALGKGYYPNDGLEWMPFMQAYAVHGDVKEMREITKLIILDKFLRLQACDLMTNLSGQESFSADVNEFIQNNICD